MAVFAVSAFWHGFYPFYYVMLLFCALLSELSKELYRARYLFRHIPYPISSILAHVISMIFMNFWGICFCLLTFEKGNIFSKSTYYFTYIIIVAGYAFMRVFKVASIAQGMEKRDKELKEAKEKKT
mmetsp:Transcript_38321/g.36676  ORF Transcript_38321/g.36676 Transcript_38321/m.36676 type:complete len:126 (+) Transcript_38321:1040-1417(+)